MALWKMSQRACENNIVYRISTLWHNIKIGHGGMEHFVMSLDNMRYYDETKLFENVWEEKYETG